MEKWKDGIWGLVTADALGVPVEFRSRMQMEKDSVIDMREYGTHSQPKGTWSDDSSMVFAAMDSIIRKKGIDYKDIMTAFQSWVYDAEYTPHGTVFDIGNATFQAIRRFKSGDTPLSCGGIEERDNGNGSLMRILPVCLYLIDREKKCCMSADEEVQTIHNASALTHAHLRSMMGCGLFYFCVKALVEEKENVKERLQRGLDAGFSYYRRDFRNYKELSNYDRLTDLDKFEKTPAGEIRGSGYVVATLEAAIWCLLTTGSYKEATLKAVNLGEDTDTVGAVTGALAGLYYGAEDIPAEWIEVLARKEWIQGLIDQIIE
ncbi:MAG: ADP-ribosylglycohydrolase family protein [Clostridiales bacterium]|nr:ADP-ribosylglycohydrolase family protein [Candidatus Blautia equi]